MKKEMQYLYKDGDSYCFMDTSSYEQIHMSEEVLGDAVGYLMPDSVISVEFYGEGARGHRTAASVDDDRQGDRARHQGATASNQVKPATFRNRSRLCRCRRSSTKATRSASTPRRANTRGGLAALAKFQIED